MTKVTILTAAALGIATLMSAPVAAQTSVDVSTAQLDLSSAKGQRNLDARLRVAVRDVCGVTPALRDLREVRDHRQCVSQARASFTQQRNVEIARAKAQDAQRMAIAERQVAEG
ncbi:MAG: UrcA family protein [Pseudomonadota bacterium]